MVRMKSSSLPLPALSRTPHLWAGLLLSLTALLGSNALAQKSGKESASTLTQPAAGAASPQEARAHRQVADAQLFYQLLMGEMLLQEGDRELAFESLLDAARQSKDAKTFRRATELAIQSRAGDRALQAAQAWCQAEPDSLQAHHYLVRILATLGRTAEAQEPLIQLVKATPSGERADILAALPRLFSRSAAGLEVAQLMDRISNAFSANARMKAAGESAIGRAWLMDRNNAMALQYAQSAHRVAPDETFGALLALDLWPGVEQAQAIVLAHLQAAPKSLPVRLQYARALTEAQQYQLAIEQLDAVTQIEPSRPAPWLTLGALHVQLRQPEAALRALETYLKLSELDKAGAPKGGSAPLAAGEAPIDDLEDRSNESANSVLQARTLAARAEELRGNFEAAERWIDDKSVPAQTLSVLQRRASLKAAQGQIDEARALIHQAPEPDAEAARAKIAAEADLLRQHKRWEDAYAVLAHALKSTPRDLELNYEQAMVAERLGRLDEMESLLRRVISLKPDYAQAYNALGYSLAERGVRLTEARELIVRALSLAPGDPFITDSLGWLEYRMGRLPEAQKLLGAAYAGRPDTEIGAHLGEVLWHMSLRDEALKVWRESQQRDPGNEVLQETLRRLGVQL
jgi:Flp pilus assembly protein TadD